jgi:methionyl-tRNA synthetase
MPKEEIGIEDFGKLELRIGKILEVNPHPNADKLYVLKIDIGTEVRQSVAGVKKWYKPEELVGKHVAVVCNLKPVNLRGVESYGMILAALTPDKASLAILTPDREIPVGTEIS